MSPSRQRSDFPGGIVAGSWTTIRGANLSGLQVKINNSDAPVYYISPTQINVQAPNDISGNVSVQVIRNGAASNTMTGPVQYALGGKTYPSALFNGHFHGELRGAGSRSTSRSRPASRPATIRSPYESGTPARRQG